MAQCRAGSSILILPASSFELGSSNGKKPKTPKKSVVGTPGTDDVSIHDPRNFLVRGGHRAYDQKIMSINKCAVQELRTANAVLAEELVKARSGSDQVRDQLREKESSIESLQATVERLEKARKLVDKKHLLQLKELNRRYKDEQSRRLALEAESATLRANKDMVDQQVDSMQEERAQLLDLLNNQRSNNSRLEATIAADAATITELRARLQSVESRLSDETAARQELFGRHKALEADLKLATERHAALTASQSEAESRLRAATSKMQLLEDELEAAKSALQAEKAAFGAERQRASSLKSDLTQLQTSAQLAAASAAADQAELERLRGQTEQLMGSNEGLRAEVARLREEVLHLTAQGVAAQASYQGLQQQRDELQQHREDMQQQLAASQETLQRVERSLREEASARVRSLQDEVAAKHRSHAEELAAKQRQWEGQLRSREKAWEDERAVMLRAHEEELTRKELELLEVRERMREAQSSVAELAAEVSTFKFQGEHYAEVYKENEELKLRIAKADEVIAARDASLAETTASHAAQLELWKAEANEVAQAAAKWKQRCTNLQAQLDARESETETSGQELRALSAKLSTSEAERVKLQEALASAESKLALASQEATSYRSQLSDVLTSHQSTSRQAETAQQDLQLRDLQLSKLTQSLNEEASRAAQLRQELAVTVSQHAKELEAKRRALDDLADQLREAERTRAVAQAEADQLRDKVVLLTREVGRARLIADAVSTRGGGTTRGAPAGSLRRSADGREPWGYPHRGDAGAGLGSGGASRQLPDSFDLDEEAELERLERRGPSGGRGPPRGGRREYDVASLEEEAESWFRSLDDERRPRHPRDLRDHYPAARGEAGGSGSRSVSRRADSSQPEQRTLEVVARPVPPQSQPEANFHPPALQLDAGGLDAAGHSVRTYDVTISPKHGGAAAEEPAGGQQQPEPQPLPLRPSPAAAVYHAPPTRSASTAPISAGGAAAAIAAAAYTAVVTPVEQQGPVTYLTHAAATPMPPPPLLRTIPAASASPSPANSAARYTPQRAQPAYRGYGIPAPHQQGQMQLQPYPYTRSDAARSYGVMTPISPAFSESASNASSNLQERLQRLLGTGKLV